MQRCYLHSKIGQNVCIYIKYNFSFIFFYRISVRWCAVLYGSRSNFQEILHNLHRFIGRESVSKFSGNFLFRVYWNTTARASPLFYETDAEKSTSLASQVSLGDEMMLLLTKNKYRNGNKCLFLITNKNAQWDARIHSHSIWFKNDKLHNVNELTAATISPFSFHVCLQWTVLEKSWFMRNALGTLLRLATGYKG